LHRAGWATPAAGDADQTTDHFVVFAGTAQTNGPAARALRDGNATLPSASESLVVRQLTIRGRPALILCGADDRGLMYALLDVADRVHWAANPGTNPFTEIRDSTESPYVRDRSLSVYTMNRAHWESRFYDERYGRDIWTCSRRIASTVS
jgi:hypothetical protein